MLLKENIAFITHLFTLIWKISSPSPLALHKNYLNYHFYTSMKLLDWLWNRHFTVTAEMNVS